MSGQGESASTHDGTCAAGVPEEPQEHPASQHATMEIAKEAQPTSIHSSHSNTTASGSENMYLDIAPVDASTPSDLHIVPVNASKPSGLHIVPMNASLLSGWNPMNKVRDKLDRCGKRVDDATRKAEALVDNAYSSVDNAWNHLKTSRSVTDAAIARVAQGTKMVMEGGRDKVFERTFEILPGEKLLKAYACHQSTSSGLVIGTLYLSTKRLIFHSDELLCNYAPSGQQKWDYSKVVLLLDQLSFVSRSSKGLDHSEKYIQVVTRDGYEFWFRGFVSYDKAIKNINEALQHNRENNTAGSIRGRSVARLGK
ncbi:hypothetical protein BT93_L1766 [Corymbia citriodora subsp. variegata]|uniref:GRAM domain-containing protein n=1 Tax=Corymbia citriodora subsp. variegata TaxID=360336 RepID=A0A8T0CPD0_CORYI|nr:hypothetical protein BT93_L1766 [Corymbia citriodora subsp. variegata]